MGKRISESLRSEVKQRWIKGESRNKIAAICGVSQGAVSGIIDEWKRSVGVTLAEQQRDLFTAMNRQGISVVECAHGFRIAKILKNMGLEEDREESFLVETYNRCIAVGFRPEDIATHFSDLISFATDCQNLGIEIEKKSGGGNSGDNDDKKGCGHRVPPPIPTILQIGRYLEKVKQEIIESELIYTEQKKETELLEVKKSSAMQETAGMLKKNRMTAEKLDWYLEMKTHLLVSGHSEDDFELVLNAISLIKENGYDLLVMAAQFSIHEQLKSSVRRLQVQNSISESKGRQLEEKATNIEQAIESKSQLLWHMVELETMGFGLKQIKRLYDVIKEINEANGFSESDGYAVKMLLDQVERNYDTLLGFEKRIAEVKTEIYNLHIQRLGQLNILSAQPYVGGALARLLGKGLREDQILKLANVVEMHPEIVQSCIKNHSDDGQQNDDNKVRLSSSSSSFLSSSPPSQPASPQTSTPTFQTSASTPLPEKYSTTKLSADGAYPGTETSIQSMAPMQEPHIKVKDNSAAAAVAEPEQGESNRKDNSSQFGNARLRDNIRNRYLINPFLALTPTFLGKLISIPRSSHPGTSQSICTTALSLDTPAEIVSRISVQRNYRTKNKTARLSNGSTSTLRSASYNACGNCALSDQESSQEVKESIESQEIRSPDSNSDQIETLPVVSITASDCNDDHTNLPLNVLDGNFETNWSSKGRLSWISLDLGSIKTIHSVKIAWYRGDFFDYYYSISVSNDGVIFTEVKRGCSGGNSRLLQQYILKEGYRARYIKITVNGNNMNDIAGIARVEVIGSTLD
jgi:hypothetical protein